MSTDNSPDQLSIIVYDHHFDKVHYALVTASAAAAIGKPVTLFFTMGACHALLEETCIDGDWRTMPLSDEPGTGDVRDRYYRDNGIGGFEELLEACQALNVQFMVCEMGLRAKGLSDETLRKDLKIEIAGMVTFLNDASKTGAVIFI